MPCARPTKTQLIESNVLVQWRPGGSSNRVSPVDALLFPIQHYLPPSGYYFDQQTLEEFADVFDTATRCVLCWNINKSDAKCKCENKCAVCNTKQHRHRECSILYADLKWWRSHGHRLRKKAQVRPNPGERAYLVVADVMKDWKTFKDPVSINMKHVDVISYYKGKQAPQRLTMLPASLLLTVASTTAAKPVRTVFDPESEVSDTFHDVRKYQVTTPRKNGAQSHVFDYSIETLDMVLETRRAACGIYPREQGSSLTTDDDCSLLALLDDTWQPPSYHEGTHYAVVTPLSMLLAVSSARQFLGLKQEAKSLCNEVCTDLDIRTDRRTQLDQNTSGKQRLTAASATPQNADLASDLTKLRQSNEDYKQELEEAREKLRTKDRRILELEVALHEAEGWTDTVTYRVGQKRLREWE